MTVTHLDPPPSRLRLVASRGPGHARDRRYRTGATLGRDARSLYRDVLQSALRSGAPVDADALRVVLATKQAHHPGPIRHFTASVIWQLMFVEVVAWCRARNLDVPLDGVDALRAVVDHLCSSGTLTPGSDPAAELYCAIDDCTGGWPDGAHPTRGTMRRGSVRSARGPKRS